MGDVAVVVPVLPDHDPLAGARFVDNSRVIIPILILRHLVFRDIRLFSRHFQQHILVLIPVLVKFHQRTDDGIPWTLLPDGYSQLFIYLLGLLVGLAIHGKLRHLLITRYIFTVDDPVYGKFHGRIFRRIRLLAIFIVPLLIHRILDGVGDTVSYDSIACLLICLRQRSVLHIPAILTESKGGLQKILLIDRQLDLFIPLIYACLPPDILELLAELIVLRHGLAYIVHRYLSREVLHGPGLPCRFPSFIIFGLRIKGHFYFHPIECCLEGSGIPYL